MSNTGAALSSTVEPTAIVAAKNLVCEIRDHITRLETRAAGLKFRLQGLQDDETDTATDTPEPVRSDTGELTHHLDLLRRQLNRLENHLTDLEQL
jgi:polyhydroxyalkanoate synthesis regulator phasin